MAVRGVVVFYVVLCGAERTLYGVLLPDFPSSWRLDPMNTCHETSTSRSIAGSLLRASVTVRLKNRPHTERSTQ